MLEAMRKGAKNIFVKIFLGVLALSFITWGVGDMFRGRTSNAIAHIGNSAISYDEYSSSLQKEIARYQQILGRGLSEEQIAQFNIKKMVLNQLINNKLIRMRIEDLHLKIGDDAAKEQLLANSMFFDESGKFSAENFNTILRANGLNKDDYISALKQDTAVRLFIDTLAAIPSSLASQAEVLYRYRNEERFADLVIIPTDFIKEVDEPSETDLVQYYQENSERFVAPELREVTYIKYGVDDVKNTIEVSEDAIRAQYEAEISNYEDPEKRDVDQYLFSSQTDAGTALEFLRTGKTGSYENAKISLGQVSKDSLTDEIKEAIFALDQGVYSDPIESQLGWHIFIVNNVVPSRIKSFSEVKDEIASYIKETEASEMFYDSASGIEDEFATGKTMEEVAKKFDLVIHKVPSVNAAGQGAGGKPLNDIPEPESFVPLAFDSEMGENSPMTLLSDNATYVTLRVDAIAPQRVKALDEVKGTAIELWKQQKKSEGLRELAIKVAEKIKNGNDPKELAKDMKLKFKISEKLKRPTSESFMEDEDGIPLSLSREIFSLKEGEVTDAYLSSNGEFVIGQLRKVLGAELNEDRFANLHNGLKNDFTDDVLRQYNDYLRSKYPITINEAMLNSSS